MSKSSLSRLAVIFSICTISSFAASITADFAVSNGNFSFGANWSYTGSAYKLTGVNSMNTSLTSPTLTASGGQVVLQFKHTHNLEATWDGGILELSVNNGAFAYVPGSSFTQNSYNQPNSISEIFGNVPHFGGLGGPKTSIVNLGNFNSGDTFRFQFHAQSDQAVVSGNANSPAWLINSAGLSNTDVTTGFTVDGSTSVPEPSTTALMLVGASTLLYFRRRG